MVNWIAGNWSQPWKCLVNHDGIFDARFMGYSTEELWFTEWEYGGTPWENPRGYQEFNPANHVQNWRDPMLVIQGDLDFRIPTAQGLSTFTALQRRGIETGWWSSPTRTTGCSGRQQPPVAYRGVRLAQQISDPGRVAGRISDRQGASARRAPLFGRWRQLPRSRVVRVRRSSVAQPLKDNRTGWRARPGLVPRRRLGARAAGLGRRQRSGLWRPAPRAGPRRSPPADLPAALLIASSPCSSGTGCAADRPLGLRQI
jgi:hypothetical protein